MCAFIRNGHDFALLEDFVINKLAKLILRTVNDKVTNLSMILGIYGLVNRFLYATKCLLARSAGADKKIQLPRQQFFFCSAQKTVAFSVIQPFQVGFNSGFSVCIRQALVLVLFGVD